MNEWDTIDTDQWQRNGEQFALECFHLAAQSVPAYREFLRKEKCNPTKVKSFADWQQIPITTKENYLTQYALQELAWGGTLGSAACIHSSSGSTGQPQYWPCSLQELKAASQYYAAIFENAFQIHKRSTLLIICFGMGTWIAGSYTVASTLLLQREGFNITTVTPGFDRSETLRILREVAVHFEQVVVAGIPSFIKDLAEACCTTTAQNRPQVHFLLAGEPFPELWRSYVIDLDRNRTTQAISMLGSADAGLIGFESNLTIQLRQLLSDNSVASAAYFDSERVPSLFHYDPTHRFIENCEQNITVTANRVIPLIRYNTFDIGGVLQSASLKALSQSLDIQQPTSGWAGNLPVVYLFGRGDCSTTLFGANIYAENIQEFLLNSELGRFSSGRFYMQTEYSDKADQTFRLHIEMAAGAMPGSLATEALATELSLALRKRSSEYARIWEEYGERALPSLLLHPYGCPDHFPKNRHKNIR